MKLATSYKLIFPDYAQNRAFHPKKHLVIESNNSDDSSGAKVRSKGVHSRHIGELGNDNSEYTGVCYRTGPDGVVYPTADLYQWGQNLIRYFGMSKRSIITDQVPENGQSVDPTLDDRMYHFYKGALDEMRKTEPNLKKRDTGLFGSYGADNFRGLIHRDFLGEPRARVQEYLSTHLYRSFDPATGSWGSGEVGYYSSNQISVRNVNVQYYMYNSERFIPLELILTNERVKRGTIGKGDESDMIVFSWPYVETMFLGADNQKAGIEMNKTGDITEFPAGLIDAYNTPAMSEECYLLGDWGTFLMRGLYSWSYIVCGSDKTKVNHYPDAPGHIRFQKTGGSWEPYVSGQNGAPIRDQDNGIRTHIATPLDAFFAGHEEALKYVDYTDEIHMCNYTSSRGAFNGTPGTHGQRLSGDGIVNAGFLSFKDAFDQRKGTAVGGKSAKGRVVRYNNSFLSPHEFEDNVTINFDGQNVNIGRVYGRQTKSLIL